MFKTTIRVMDPLLLFSIFSCCAMLVASQGNFPGYLNTIAQSFNYRVYCGTLDASLGDQPQRVGDFCQYSMQDYRSIPETSALYSTSGVRLPDTFAIGRGTAICMCFSLADLQGKMANFCLFVDTNGNQNESSTGAVIGNYERGSKALPMCFDINTDSVTSSLGAAGTATRAQIQTGTLTMTTSNAPNLAFSLSVVPETSEIGGNAASSQIPTETQTSKNGSTGGPVAVEIWLPIVFGFILGVIGIVYAHKTYRLAKAKKLQENLA